MRSWLRYLRDGFSRSLSADRISHKLAAPTGASIANLKPFLRRHWPRAALGIVLVVLGTLLSLPTPLITRFLVDHVILAKELRWLIWAVAGSWWAVPSTRVSSALVRMRPRIFRSP